MSELGSLLITATSISGGHLPHTPADKNELQVILEIAFGILGALAVLMISISGLRYVLSAGNPEKTSKAKNGIIYSIVGLVVAMTAEAIVTYVVKNL